MYRACGTTVTGSIYNALLLTSKNSTVRVTSDIYVSCVSGLGHLVYVSDLWLFVTKIKWPRKSASHERKGSGPSRTRILWAWSDVASPVADGAEARRAPNTSGATTVSAARVSAHGLSRSARAGRWTDNPHCGYLLTCL